MKASPSKIIGLAASGALAVSALPIVSALASPTTPGHDAPQGNALAHHEAEAHHTAVAAPATVDVTNIQGTFWYDQGVKLDNSSLAPSLYKASQHICGLSLLEPALAHTAGEAQGKANGAPEALAVAPGEPAHQVSAITSIRVSGDVDNAYTALVADLEKKAPASKVLGCTCAGNPADGRASANVAVQGFMLAALIKEAAPEQGVNTITFVSADGYRISLPLRYIRQHYSIIVTQANGEAMGEAFGCSNQLWLGSTAARYFARDIVAIELTAEENPPAAPDALGPQAANQPNVGILWGE